MSGQICERLSDEILHVATVEGMDPDLLRDSVSAGTVVILGKLNNCKPVAFGKDVTAKIGANIGTSPTQPNSELEFEKARTAVDAGADTVMDLSLMGNVGDFHKILTSELNVPICSNPVFQALAEDDRDDVPSSALTASRLLRVIEKQARNGLSSLTIHCALTRQLLAICQESPRVMTTTSRAAALLARSMIATGSENPLFEYFDSILDILSAEGVCLAIGNTTRAGTIVDRFGDLNLAELKIMGELVCRARQAHVQVRVEVPIGHVSIDQIPMAVRESKALCHQAPIGALGPLVTDIGLGFDHVVQAIGCALAVSNGVDFVSAVSRREHIGIPAPCDTHEAVLISRLAAHAGDLIRLGRRRESWDREMSMARVRLDRVTQIRLSISPQFVASLCDSEWDMSAEACCMCGEEYCPLKIAGTIFRQPGSQSVSKP